MKTDQCYINIPKAQRKFFIYRIISLDRLYDLFQTKKNTLIKPHLWDDPFENFVLNLKGKLPNGDIVEFRQRHNFFGQCWSLKSGSDAMWRIYSTDKKSVCIQVRINKLTEITSAYAEGAVYIGKVRYLTGERLIAWSKRVMRHTTSPGISLLAKTLLVKRTSFAHESEIRLLYFSDERYLPFSDDYSKGESTAIYKYNVDPEWLIESLILDPRLSSKEAEDLKEQIRSQTKFSRKILHSNLYAPPQEMILNLGPQYIRMKRSSGKITYSGKNYTLIKSKKTKNTQLILPVDYT